MALAYLSPSYVPGGKRGLYPVIETTNRHAVAQFALGTRAEDILGNKYLYVQAGGVIAATDAVAASGTEGLAAVVQSANTATGAPWIGVGHAVFADNEFGWIQTHGVMSVKSGNITAGAAVLPKTTAGTVNNMAATDWSNRVAQAITDDSGGVCSIFLQ